MTVTDRGTRRTQEARVAAPPLTDPIRALLEPPTLGDPAPTFHALRSRDPVHWNDGIESWVLTRHADCLEVLKDNTRFGSDWRRAGEGGPAALLSIQSLDPPEHTGVRQLLVAAFRAASPGSLAETIERDAREILAGFGSTPFDFTGQVAEPLALRTITNLLGVPAPDLAWFRPISAAVVDAMDAGLRPETHEPGLAARAELAALADGWLADPPDLGGIVGYLVTGVGRLDRATVDRAVLDNSLRAVLHAGFESVSRLLSHSLVALLDAPDGMARFRSADPHLAVDELVRHTSPVQADARVCLADTTVGQATVHQGQAVTVLIGAANRDPQRFADPDGLHLDRKPNPHLGFGRGAHACVGSALAGLVARVLLGVLAHEHPDVHACDAPIYRRNATLRGVERFDVCLT